MARDLSFPMQMLAAAMAAKCGRLTVRDQLDLSVAALSAERDAAERAAVADFLAACRGGDQAAAGDALQDWLLATFPAPPDAIAAFDWQRRADCGL